MMRWLALALIAANLFYGGWQWRQQAAEAVEVPRPAAEAGHQGVPRLLLLSERPAAAQPREPVPVEAGAEPPLEPPLEPLPEPSPEQPPSCGMLGPFGEQVSARQVQGRLSDTGIDAELQSRDVVVRKDLWVHIPPLPTREAALRLLRELQAKGVDSFLIANGELERGISLGIFSRPDSAESVARQQRQQGYEVAIQPLPRHQTEYWLMLAPEAAAAVDPPLLETLRRGGLKVEFSSQPCIGVAQSQEFD